MVPDAAIGTEQVRKFVYVVDQDGVARQHFVTLGEVVGRLARDQGRHVGRRPRRRQWPDAGASGTEGDTRGSAEDAPQAAAPQAKTN